MYGEYSHLFGVIASAHGLSATTMRKDCDKSAITVEQHCKDRAMRIRQHFDDSVTTVL
jgi:hypothetical protein